MKIMGIVGIVKLPNEKKKGVKQIVHVGGKTMGAG